MPTVEQLRGRLIKKLSELFQLNQPDLDFGFYRIMHAKAQEVQDFIDTDLLNIVKDAFGGMDDARETELQAAYENAVREAREEYGAPEPEKTPKAQKAKAALDAVRDTAGSEADVYDHLYRFFERYYDDGDFISRRYYTRETSGKAAPFAVPYNGEEVKLHWANADQYYIKSTEYFSNFTLDLRQAKEIRALDSGLFEQQEDTHEQGSLKVHFKVVEATEGEHGNVKTSEQNKRFFILHKKKPVEFNGAGELVCKFEYRPDPEKTGLDKSWRDKRNTEAVDSILEHLQTMATAGAEPEKQAIEYLRLFKVSAPTDSDKKRPLLAKYINQYTARNTMDYFIHKDLGGFLRRELDFYIKNEVMRLDDIENADAPAVESYLSRIKVLRKIAGKLIDFLAQLEDFQKKLWLKKKFIVETHYCITLDWVPDELCTIVAANAAQCEEWIKLFAIDEIQADLHNPGFSRPLTVEFLKANDKLVLDTRFFDDDFKARLLASIENFDEQCDGLLIHSENFQALNLLKERYKKQIDGIYTDPPYNTSASEIAYKNSYKHSSWLSFLDSRVALSRLLLTDKAIACYTIDDFEFDRLRQLLVMHFGHEQLLGNIAIRNNPSGRSTAKGVSIAHEYALFFGNTEQSSVGRLQRNERQQARYDEADEIGNFEWTNFRKHGGTREESPKMFFPFFVSESNFRIPNMEWNETKKEWTVNEQPLEIEEVVFPVDDSGQERRWKWAVQRVKDNLCEFKVDIDRTGKRAIYVKTRINDEGILPLTWWDKKEYSATAYGTNLLKNIFRTLQTFSYPKSIHAVIDSLRVIGVGEDSKIIDYFAGSGTTGHAVINLNREDSGKRKYILVEMGDYFDTVLNPRIAKVVYSESWKDGKPTARNTGISHCFKTIRLESYEDTLNNLRLEHNPQREKALAANPSLKEGFMLRYLLDVETRGSQSLLNIDAFTDPCRYTLDVKKPGTDEYATCAVDLIETFNYLIGLRVLHTSVPQTFQAAFTRITDPELPQNRHTRLVVDGRIRKDTDGPWWFRKVEGWTPKDPANPDNGQQEKVLVVWRKLTGDIEQDNLMLDEWFQTIRINPRDFEFDTIYVNGSNNLPNLKLEGENWKVRLIEEEFMKRMWEAA